MKKLNGWMRMWVFMGAIYTAFWATLSYETVINTPVSSVGPWTKYQQAAVDSGWRFEDEADTAEYQKLVVQKVIDNDWQKYWINIFSVIMALVLPLLSLLAFGYGIAWVRRGFRQDSR